MRILFSHTDKKRGLHIPLTSGGFLVKQGGGAEIAMSRERMLRFPHSSVMIC